MTTKHFGMCDASAALALNRNHFIVANDEDNILRVYHAERSKGFIGTIDISTQINNPENREADIEGAALLNGTIYWITSHGRNKKGKFRPARHNFFANKITLEGTKIGYAPVGQTYTELLKDMSNDARLKKYELEELAKLAPKNKCGLNIEGLTATPNNELLIGFRNPIPCGKALLKVQSLEG